MNRFGLVQEEEESIHSSLFEYEEDEKKKKSDLGQMKKNNRALLKFQDKLVNNSSFISEGSKKLDKSKTEEDSPRNKHMNKLSHAMDTMQKAYVE
jgi:hypothetical protein